MKRQAMIAAAGMIAGALGVSGCISAPDQAPPAWFTERVSADANSYPSLQDVPRTTIANTDVAYWERIAAEMRAAGQAVKAHPRAQWTAPDDPVAFAAEARAALEATRASHE